MVTFYSYKGGVGRTLAMANVAVQLSRWGYSTLCVDWDLEAPGLHSYFAGWLPHPPRRGLLDLICDLAAGLPAQWRDYVTHLRAPDEASTTAANLPDVIFAGHENDNYAAKLQSLDWSALYAHRGLGTALEAIRNDWTDTYEFIFIDSRTGLTDVGGICTVQLPDILVLLLTANNQSLRGTTDIATRAISRRNTLPLDRGHLLCVPVPSRFDSRVEHAIAGEWLARFAESLAPLYADWLHRKLSPEEILAQLRLPYVAYWSYGEQLPVLQEQSRSPETLA